MLKFAVFVSGGGTDLQSIIDAKNEGKINGEIALVLSNRQKAYGLQRAKDAGIETTVVKKDDALIVKMLKERNIDFIVLAGYLAILTDELIDAYPNKIIEHSSFSYSFFLLDRECMECMFMKLYYNVVQRFRGQPCTLFQILSMGDRLLNKLLVIYRI